MKSSKQNSKIQYAVFVFAIFLFVCKNSVAQRNADGTYTIMFQGNKQLFSPIHPGNTDMIIDTLETTDEKGKKVLYFKVSEKKADQLNSKREEKFIFLDRNPSNRPGKSYNADGSVSTQHLKPPTCDCVVDTLEVELPDGNFTMRFLTTDHNVLVKETLISEGGNAISIDVYENPESMPKFLKGRDDLLNYIKQDLIQKNSVEKFRELAEVSFIVLKNGKIENITVDKGNQISSPSLGTNLIRVLKNMPPWTPGMVNGQMVNAFYYLKIYFD